MIRQGDVDALKGRQKPGEGEGGVTGYSQISAGSLGVLAGDRRWTHRVDQGDCGTSKVHRQLYIQTRGERCIWVSCVCEGG